MAAPPPEPIILSTFASIIETFIDFLIVSSHAILFSRALYPPDTFITARKYNLEVKENRHPEVSSWILAASLAIQEQLLKSEAQRVSFVIYQEDAKEVIERWVFDVDNFPLIPKENASSCVRSSMN
jgi:mitotic spindle assembly checkpoint protein MAD2B